MDQEFIELRRQEVLEAVDGWFHVQAVTSTELKKLKERIAKLVWEVFQLRNHVTPEIRQQILMERTVNELDPDFSFLEAVQSDNTRAA